MKSRVNRRRVFGVVTVLVLVGIVAYSRWDRGTIGPQVDYLSRLDEQWAPQDPSLSAWPLYQTILDQLTPTDTPGLLRRDALETDLAPSRAWLEENASLIPILVEASQKPSLGRPYHPYRYHRSWRDYFRGLGRDTDAREAERLMIESVPPGEGHTSMASAETCRLDRWRQIVNLLALGARDASSRGDHERALELVEAAGRISHQVQDRATMIEQLIGSAMGAIASAEFRAVVMAGRDSWSASQMKRLASTALGHRRDRSLEEQTLGEWYFQLDFLQAAFTDDGHGDGVLLTDLGSTMMGAGVGWSPGGMVARAALHFHASRKETREALETLRAQALIRIQEGESAQDLQSALPDVELAVVKAMNLPMLYESLEQRNRHDRMQRDVNRLVVALIEDARSRGSFPETMTAVLEELESSGLDEHGRPLQYRVGEDGRPYLFGAGPQGSGFLHEDGRRDPQTTVFLPIE